MWINELCGSKKAVIGMVHLDALPGTVRYDASAGLPGIVAHARADYESLAAGGIDAVIFCNENDKPYSKSVGPHIVAAMTSVIGQVVGARSAVPFGVDVQWDSKAAVAVALATGASFIRGILCGTFCGDLGLFAPDAEGLVRFRSAIGAEHVKLLTNLCPEFSCSLDTRPIDLVAKTAVKSALVDGLCVSGVMAGTSAEYDDLVRVREAVPDVPVFANTGVNMGNVGDILKIADACVVATCLKAGQQPGNRIDRANVERFIRLARS